MPPDRRRRRFRRPGTGRWLTESLPSLRIELASQVRATLTAWMRLYGEANNVRGLATGPIETRFARLRENTGADTLIVWTTPGRWAGGEGLSLRFPQLHLEFVCSLADGHLVATKVAQVTEDARPPDREPGAVGVVVHPERVTLPPEDVDSSGADAGVDLLEQHFARLAGRRWGGFATPLRAALEAEAREDDLRTERLTVPFKEASLAHGGEEDVWRLKGVTPDALRALDDGEWLEILDDQGRSRTSARVIDTHPSAGTLVVGVRTASDPPRTGFVRPRSRKKILEQKRALLEELASPTGSLPNLVRLVAAPASMPTPHAIRPERFVNPAVVRNRSQSRAVALALGLEEGQALLIQGPPGTGKSTTAAEIDVQLVLRDPGVRILVCSHSNHGTDNMLMKVLPFLEDAAERIARVGFYERIAKEARPFYAAADADLGEKNIIFTTIDALVLQDVAGARVYDYVLLDEANRAGVLDSLLALARGKRMILVGDPMQLQPVMSEAEQQMVSASMNGAAGHQGRGRGNRPALVGVAQPGAQNVIGKSLFAWIQERRFSPASTVLLDQQNRMHPAIGELVSRVFYSNRVRTGPAAPRRGTGLPAFPSPVTWVDTRSLRGNVESRAGGTSLFNVAEARLVTSITRHLAAYAPANLSIGVITAYAEQRDLLRRLMGPHDWPPDRMLEIDTVDAFEGREKDIIVLSLVRANRRRDIGFLRLEQRLNVAVSRSRRLVVIVGDTSTLRSGMFHHLVQTAQSVGQVVPAPKLIGQFLSRGAPRRPRREFEEHVAPVAGEVVLVEEGVVSPAATAPGFQAGAEAPGLAGSRRRRRRAWERRRERLRVLHEQGGEPEATPPQAEPEQPPAAETTEPRWRVRRRRRLAGSTPMEAAAPAEQPFDVIAQPEPTVEPVVSAPAVRRRPRVKKVEEPAVPIVEVAPIAEPVVSAPVRPRPRVKKIAEPATIEVAAVVEPVVSAPISRRPRVKKVEEPAVPVVEVAPIAEPVVSAVVRGRRRIQKVEEAPVAAEPLPAAEPVVSAPVRRKPRAKSVEEPASPPPIVVAEPLVVARRSRRTTIDAPSSNGTGPIPPAEQQPAPRRPRTRRVPTESPTS